MLTRTLAALAAATLLIIGGATAATATPPHEDKVCGPLDSGKIDTTGDPDTVTVDAPAGLLIDGYCVKAGSAKHGGGPVYVDVEPVQSVTFGHPTGKAVSHYSVSYTERPRPEEPPALVHEDVTVDLVCAEPLTSPATYLVTSTTTTTTTPYVFDETAWAWITGESTTTVVSSAPLLVSQAEAETYGVTLPSGCELVVEEPPVEEPPVEEPKPPVIPTPSEPVVPTDEDGEPTGPRQQATDVERGESLAETGPADLPLALGTMTALIGLGLGLRRWATS